MINRKLLTAISCQLALLPLIGQAQSNLPVEEIVVTAAPAQDRVMPSSLVLDDDALREVQPVVMADVFRNINGVSLRTNSRGDSVVRVRGAEERQTQIFLDGAPLATPWDGRADLALLPAGLIARVEVTRAVAPIEYGANAVAGAVDLTSRLPGIGYDIAAEVQRGSYGLENTSAIVSAGFASGWAFVAGAARIERDAERIADRESVAFDPSPTRARSNTDIAGNSYYLSSAYAAESFLIRASVLHADVQRGVAAEGNLDPELSSPRFWRTPKWRLTQATVNASWDISTNTELRATGWRQWFEQAIDSFSDSTYATLDERETGDDDTHGARLVFSWDLQPMTLRLVTTAQESTHVQQELATSNGEISGLVAGTLLRYRQRLTTFGAEADYRLSDSLTTTFGVARDRAETPLTGDKPSQPVLSATGWSGGVRWQPTASWVGALTVGQRSRFPTPRELYGAALGRFLLNPDLRAERSLLTDLSVKSRFSDALSLDLAAWLNDSDDTLSQRRVEVGGVSRRQRYNTNGSLTYGLEAAATWYLDDALRLELSAAWQDGQVERDNDGDRPVLLQRPKSQANVALDWQAGDRLDLRLEANYVGTAFDIDENGDVTRLPDSTSTSVRGFLKLAELRDHDVQLTLSVDNLNDALILPQLGLPAPGRTVRVGLRID